MRFCHLTLSAATLAFIVAAQAATPAFIDRFDYQFSPFAIADVNGDGIPDIIETVSATGPGVAVWFGNGNGTFRTGPTTVTGFNAYGAPQLADVNGDGKLDLVSVGTIQSGGIPTDIGVNLGNGDGTFARTLVYPDAVGDSLYALAIADFNQDGIPDAAAVGRNGVWVSLGTGGGAFNPGTLYPVSGSQTEGLSGILSLDFNGDGKPDIAELTNTGFTVLLGNGDATFQQAIPTTSPYTRATPTSFVAGYLNRDTFPDIVLANDNEANVVIFLGKGNGTFEAPAYTSLPTNVSVTIGDVNGDGISDLVTNGVYIALGNGNGTFKSPIYYTAASSTYGSGAGTQFLSDLTNNKRLDVVALGPLGAMSVLLNEGKGVFEDGSFTSVAGGGAGCMASADYNGDGHTDVAVSVVQGISIMLGTGSAKAPFKQGTVLTIPYGSACPVSADVNGDGIPDLLITTTPPSTTGQMTAYLGNGNGTFTAAPSVAVSKAGTFAAADFNGDGKIDFATITNQLALGNGDGTFQTPKTFVPFIAANTKATGFSAIAVGDLNGDGKPDVVLTDGIHGYLYVLINNGKGGWTETFYNAGQTGCGAGYIPVIGNLSGNGLADILVGDDIGGGCIYLNQGGGKFAYSKTLTSPIVGGGSVPWITDINGDGIPDVLLLEGQQVGVYLGQGSGSFAAPFYLGAGSGVGGIVTVNLHGQSPNAGTPDIVVTSGSKIEAILNLTK